jgi:hypothetical protein
MRDGFGRKDKRTKNCRICCATLRAGTDGSGDAGTIGRPGGTMQ